jgi:hypothetical protein
VWKPAWRALGGGCTRSSNGSVIGARSAPPWGSGGRGRRASVRSSTNTPPGRTTPGHLPGGWREKGSRCGCFWMSRALKRPITPRNAPTDAECYGANAAKGHAARRGIAGWSGSCPCATPVASAGVPRFRCWSKWCHVYLKARDLI